MLVPPVGIRVERPIVPAKPQVSPLLTQPHFGANGKKHYGNDADSSGLYSKDLPEFKILPDDKKLEYGQTLHPLFLKRIELKKQIGVVRQLAIDLGEKPTVKDDDDEEDTDELEAEAPVEAAADDDDEGTGTKKKKPRKLSESAQRKLEESQRLHAAKRAELATETKKLKRIQEKYTALKQNGSIMAAQKGMANGHMRMVMNIAKGYRNRGLSYQDLIQEGAVGLMKATERYDYTTGNQFTTYSTWWVRQNITRALMDSARTIRIPAYMFDRLSKYRAAFKELSETLPSDAIPSIKQLSEKLELEPKDVERIQQLDKVMTTFSLNHRGTGVKDTEGQEVGDLTEETREIPPEQKAQIKILGDTIKEIARFMLPTERIIMAHRLGLPVMLPTKLKHLTEVTDSMKAQIDAVLTSDKLDKTQLKALKTRRLKDPTTWTDIQKASPALEAALKPVVTLLCGRQNTPMDPNTITLNDAIEASPLLKSKVAGLLVSHPLKPQAYKALGELPVADPKTWETLHRRSRALEAFLKPIVDVQYGRFTSLETVGQALGITRERVRQQQDKATVKATRILYKFQLIKEDSSV